MICSLRVSDQSSIEWTDATWNPVRGCSKISPGCKHCYAETFSERFRGTPGHPFEYGFDLRLIFAKLPEPLRWGRARRIFVNSMSDLFHEQVPDAYIEEVFRVMVEADWHEYQLLTKRAERLRSFSQTVAREDHIWLGVSVEDRKYGLPRIEALRRARAGKRFLSIEPLLEDLGPLDLRGIDWVIVGGESGRGARPMHVDWVLSIREQCRVADVPFFFKQWGGVNKKKAGRELAGKVYEDFPSSQTGEVPDRNTRYTMLARAEARAAALEQALGPEPLVRMQPGPPGVKAIRRAG